MHALLGTKSIQLITFRPLRGIGEVAREMCFGEVISLKFWCKRKTKMIDKIGCAIKASVSKDFWKCQSSSKYKPFALSLRRSFKKYVRRGVESRVVWGTWKINKEERERSRGNWKLGVNLLFVWLLMNLTCLHTY